MLAQATLYVVATMVNRDSCSPAVWCQCRYTRTSRSNLSGFPIPARGDDLAIALRSRVSKTTTRVLNGSREETSSCAARRVPSSDQTSDRASTLSGSEIWTAVEDEPTVLRASHMDLLGIPDAGAESPRERGPKPVCAHDLQMPGRGMPNTGPSESALAGKGQGLHATSAESSVVLRRG
jgi:hypothetical protein